MTIFCDLIVLSCKLFEIVAKVACFVVTCNGFLTRTLHKLCQTCCKLLPVVMQFDCFSLRWHNASSLTAGTSQNHRWTVRSALKICVRLFHGLLTAAIVSCLLYYKTDLRRAVDDRDVFYCGSFFTTLTVSLVMYYTACFVNPGYVPIPIRSRHNTFDSDEEDVFPVPETTQLVDPNLKLRKCGFCGILQPLRARHCEDCNQCVRRFDHHCPWLETCIGEGNHRYFLVFVLSKAALTIWASVILWRALEFHTLWGEWLKINALLLVSVCVTCAAAVTVSILFCLHAYLMAANFTTWEFVSRHRISYLQHLDEEHNPFHEGYCTNMRVFLCSRTHRRWDDVYRANTPGATIHV